MRNILIYIQLYFQAFFIGWKTFFIIYEKEIS